MSDYIYPGDVLTIPKRTGENCESKENIYQCVHIADSEYNNPNYLGWYYSFFWNGYPQEYTGLHAQSLEWNNDLIPSTEAYTGGYP